jgi:hypothetical protein
MLISKNGFSQIWGHQWHLTSLPSATLTVEIILVSRPRFTDARKLRPSRPWNLNGITMAKYHPPICACHQVLWHPLLPTGEESLKIHHFSQAKGASESNKILLG